MLFTSAYIVIAFWYKTRSGKVVHFKCVKSYVDGVL